MNLSLRSDETEWMDDLAMGGDTLFQTLEQLRLINHWLGGNHIGTQGVLKMIEQCRPPQPLEIVDVGCGGGDGLRHLAQALRKRNISARFWGLDANPHVIQYARQHSMAYPEIEYLEENIWGESFALRQFDFVTCSLFLHHFNEEELCKLLPVLIKKGRYGLVINDLHRSVWAHRLFKLVCIVFNATAMVRNDGLISIRKGFLRREWEVLLEQLQLPQYEIRWKWAFRHQILIRNHYAS